MNMKPSINCFNLAKQFEGCRLKAYRDGAGTWTNGIGNTHGVVPGTTITMAQAQADFDNNMLETTNYLNLPGVITVDLSQNQFDAIADFVFNEGSGRFQTSSMRRLLNEGNYTGAAAEFDKWITAGGKVEKGLVLRRQAEKDLFTKE